MSHRIPTRPARHSDLYSRRVETRRNLDCHAIRRSQREWGSKKCAKLIHATVMCLTNFQTATRSHTNFYRNRNMHRDKQMTEESALDFGSPPRSLPYHPVACSGAPAPAEIQAR